MRAKFDAAVATAQAAGGVDNVWTTDPGQAGFAVPPDANLTTTSALWPKLFRRISSFFGQPGGGGSRGLPAWLAANKDPCIDLDTGSWTNLHNFVVWDAGSATVRLTKSVQRLMFKG